MSESNIAASQPSPSRGFLIQRGQTLVCLGDSITQAQTGYCPMIAALIAANYPERAIRVLNAGIGGNKIPDLLARLDRDVLAHRPDWLTISIGINDVWHSITGWGTGGVSLVAYRVGLAALVDKVRQAAPQTQIILLPPTVIEENCDSEGNQQLLLYREAVREVARERNLRVAPTDMDLDAALRAPDRAIFGGEPGKTLTTDGVHMRPTGDAILAVAVLKTLGFFSPLEATLAEAIMAEATTG